MSKIKIIVGPPCAGKSTYVVENKGSSDVVVDYDKIAMALGSSESHNAPKPISYVASKARFASIDAVLEGVSADSWIIHTSPNQQMIDRYEEAGASFYLLDTDLETCLERSVNRPAGTDKIIEDWFDSYPSLPNVTLVNSSENKMTKAYSVITVKSINEDNDKRIIKGIASTPSPDRDNDVMEMSGVKFALPIPLLWQHNHNQPIGEVTDATVTDDGIEITASIAKIEEDGNLKNRIDEAWQSIKSGLVKCLSIGFRTLEYNYIKETYGLHIKEWEWYELSAVTVPANPDAVITSVKQIKRAFADAPTDHSPTTVKSRDEDNTDAQGDSEDEPETDDNTEIDSDAESKTLDYIQLIDPYEGSIPLITLNNDTTGEPL